MKVNNLRISSAFMAIVVAGGIAVGSISNAYGDTKYKQGTFISETVEDDDLHYNQYVVKKGDTLSKISIKICRYFNQEKSTKYWPSIAFLNNYPRTVNPGDIIVFPETFEKLESLNSDLRKNGWTARYIQNNRIYEKNIRIKPKTYSIQSLLAEIYGKDVTIDDNFIDAYLSATGLEDKYCKEDLQAIENDVIFELTDWIPSINELDVQTKSTK